MHERHPAGERVPSFSQRKARHCGHTGPRGLVERVQEKVVRIATGAPPTLQHVLHFDYNSLFCLLTHASSGRNARPRGVKTSCGHPLACDPCHEVAASMARGQPCVLAGFLMVCSLRIYTECAAPV